MDISHDSAKLACLAAIATWRGSEWAYARDLQEREGIDEQWLKNWLKQWMLSRTAPGDSRKLLVSLLNEVVRPEIVKASEFSNPYDVVPRMAALLGENRATRGCATSLTSKFATNLFPAIYSPYDSRARKGLRAFQKNRVRAHDYVTYMREFSDFVSQFESYVDQSDELTEIRKNAAIDHLPDKIFVRRASDKMLMLLGGFSATLMAQDVPI